ncbi:MAG: DNA primase [bacterium]|nr:DNA primase [bacterium]
MDPKEEVKTRLDIIDIVGEYVALKPAGANHKALCPFHHEKTPSFMVSRDRQIWRCFGCSEGGDVFSFVMKMEGLDFPGALRLLAQKAGVTLRRTDPQVSTRRNTLLEIVDAAAGFFQALLRDSPHAELAREYLQRREMNPAAVETFGLGWAPDSWEATGRFLQERGFTERDIFEAGLLVKKERGSGFYDRFRNRLIFPIHDGHGQTVGFGGRTLDPKETGAKYINTPQTDIYNKGVIVYNLHRAKQDIRTLDRAVLVEGYMDAIASWEAGVKNVVAVAGTALTADQVKLLKRFSANFSLAFDMDAAGLAAASRGIDLMLAAECNVHVIQLPFGKDPDECVRKDPSAWRTAVESAAEFMEFSFAKTLAAHPLTGAANKKQVAKVLLSTIGKIGSAVERSHWLQRLANTIDVPEQVLRELLPRPSLSHVHPAVQSAARVDERERWQRLEEQLVTILVFQPARIASTMQWLGPEQVQEPHYQQLYRQLILYYNKITSAEGKVPAATDFRRWLQGSDAAELAALVDTLWMAAERDFGDFVDSVLTQEVATICTELRREHLRRQIKTVQQELQAAEAARDTGAVERLTRQFSELTTQLHLLGS